MGQKLKSPIPRKPILFWSFLFITLIFIGVFWSIQPSNNRQWETGMEKIAHIEINQDQLIVQNLRNFQYDQSGIINFDYLTQEYQFSDISQVWLVVEPFTQHRQIAHTYFIFDFHHQSPIAISVESRREKDEDYHPVLGAFKKYELIYIWSTETDQTIRRVALENNQLYMYPLQISSSAAAKLLRQLAETTQQLETTPRFYNTLTSNCTNELAKAANQVKPNSVPWNWAYIFPGYSAEELYKLKLIPTDQPLDKITERYTIHPIVAQIYQQPNFSELLRQFLTN